MDPDIAAEELQRRYKDLELEDEEDNNDAVTVTNPINTASLPEFFLVGVLFYDGEISDQHLSRTLSKVWNPKLGVTFKRIGPKHRFLLKFYHKVDYERVLKGSPWTCNNKLFALAPRQAVEDPTTIEVRWVMMWIQVFGVPLGFISSHVCEAVGNFCGQFIEADSNNFKIARPLYLRVRVSIDTTKPIKRRMRLRINDGVTVTVQFQYERLPSMCFICGMFQHTDISCPLLYISKEPPKKMYEQSIRATIRKNMVTEEDRWLRDGNGFNLVPTGSMAKPVGIEEAYLELGLQTEKGIIHIEEDGAIIAVNDPKRKRVVDGKENVFAGLGSEMKSDDKAGSGVRARQLP